MLCCKVSFVYFQLYQYINFLFTCKQRYSLLSMTTKRLHIIICKQRFYLSRNDKLFIFLSQCQKAVGAEFLVI